MRDRLDGPKALKESGKFAGVMFTNYCNLYLTRDTSHVIPHTSHLMPPTQYLTPHTFTLYLLPLESSFRAEV